MMRLFDEKFRKNKLKYFVQALLGGAAVGVALQLFDVVNKPVIIASFGASAFVAFTMPHQKISKPRCLIGGYVIGILVGIAVHCITLIPVPDEIYILEKELHITGGALAVGLAMFLMAITNTEHAPATGIALGLVINNWNFLTVVLILAGISVISGIQKLLKPWMMDLIE